MVSELWKTMDQGGLSLALKSTLPQFNGKLFKDHTVLPLNRAQIELLRKAADADWQFVEPAIFGTLLERALDPTERHARVAQILDMLTALGRVRQTEDGRFAGN